ncbi:hypothetical protein [Streptomyces sp. NPDC059928]|uniref:hypothetical protein n=1 Tax=unclassified Streptomyces TaxID=2593676 RepID=UPI0036640098
MSGFKHSGMSREDYETREQLLDAAALIEQRWPGQHSALSRSLRDLGNTITEECAPDGPGEGLPS